MALNGRRSVYGVCLPVNTSNEMIVDFTHTSTTRSLNDN